MAAEAAFSNRHAIVPMPVCPESCVRVPRFECLSRLSHVCTMLSCFITEARDWRNDRLLVNLAK